MAFPPVVTYKKRFQFPLQLGFVWFLTIAGQACYLSEANWNTVTTYISYRTVWKPCTCITRAITDKSVTSSVISATVENQTISISKTIMVKLSNENLMVEKRLKTDRQIDRSIKMQGAYVLSWMSFHFIIIVLKPFWWLYSVDCTVNFLIFTKKKIIIIQQQHLWYLNLCIQLVI